MHETESNRAGAAAPADGPVRKIRVAQVITSVVLGGGGQVMSALARNIDTSAFKMDVYCVLEGGDLVEYIRSLGFNIEVLPICREQGFIRYDLARWLGLVLRLRRGRYDIVHTHLFRADLVGAAAAVLAGRRPIVKTLHNMGTRKRQYHRIIERMLNLVTRRVVCVSASQRAVTIDRDRVNPDKIVTIRNGVRMDRFDCAHDRDAIAAGIGLDPSRPIVGTVGRLIAEKGHRYLLQAVPHITRRSADVQFVIVGDGSLREALERQMREAGIDNVVITGLRPDIPELLGIMDVFVFPSLSEGSPIAALEAMAAGVALACSDIAALREIVRDEETGLIFPAADADALAHAVCRLLADRELRRSLSRRARDMVREEFSEVTMMRAYENLYRRELQASGRP